MTTSYVYVNLLNAFVLKRLIILAKIIGILGILLILYGYYLLSVSPDIELNEVIKRVRVGILIILIGDIALVFFIAKR